MFEFTNNKMRLLTLSDVLCALVFVATAYLPRIPIPNGGYVHISDAFIYLSAILLPTPYACAVGAIGAGLADALTGYIIYAPGTIVIKALMVLFFSSKSKKLVCARNFIAVVPAGVVCVAGYYLSDAILLASFAAPLASVYFNVMQAAASAIIFIILAFIFDKFVLKNNMKK